MFGRMAASVLALTGVAYAQTEAPAPTVADASADRVVYEASYFAAINPQTALDMVRQTPGFSLNGGDDERRGFSGAVGNLLLDGVRPSTKAQDLESILSQIPANQVVRIELLRGAEVAGDASGQAVLLNLVRTPTGGSGVFTAGFELTSRDVFAPQGEASYSGRSGTLEYGLGLEVYSDYRDLPGWRRELDPLGVVTASAVTPGPRDYREVILNGNVAFDLGGGRLSSTSQVKWWRYHADNDFIYSDALGAPDFTERTVFEEIEPSFEVGANYERDFGPWSATLVGLANRRRYESEEVGASTGSQNGSYAQNNRQEWGETIARATLARPLTARQRLEFGGEAALNTLDQTLSFIENGVQVPVFNSNVSVEENRAELFATHTWRFADPWALETRVAWETSTLTFSGDTEDEVELSFWKPSLQLSRNFAGNNQLRARIYRDVGQLDFADFASAAEVQDGIIAGGNPGLKPQTDWRAELGADLRFPGGAALTLTLTQHWYSDVADLVVLTNNNNTPNNPADDSSFDAPGNIGDGEATSLDINFSTPVPLLSGSRLTINGNLWDTEVTDPVTGRHRIISEHPESEINVSFRQDLPDWRFAWGVEAEKVGEIQAYRLNEIDTSEEGPYVDIFLETTALPHNLKLTFWALNVFDGGVERDRRFYAPDRNGPLASQELRQRHFTATPWFRLELSGSF